MLPNAAYYNVCTPQFFREIRVTDDHQPTSEEERELAELHEVAKQLGTYVERTAYPRG